MGILGLNPFLNNKLKQPRTRNVKLIRFAGMQISIDGHNWAYANIAVANKVVTQETNVGFHDPNRDRVIEKWLTLALEVVCTYLSHRVVPVFVFDGVHIPEKAATQDKRKQEKLKIKEEIEAIRKELSQVSPLDYDPEKIKRLEQLLSRSNYISKEEMAKLQHLLTSIGIPVLQAKGEAEQLCAAMAREGLVAAVDSEDTDTLVYGCPLMITSFAGNYYVEEDERYYRNVTCVSLDDILKDFSWKHEQFVDFCITLGCDFNKRIKGLGPVTAFNLIQEYGSIDKYPDKYDLTSLNYKKCRSIFEHQPPVHVVDGKDVTSPVTNNDLQVNRKAFFDCGQSVIKEYSLADSYYPRLYKHYKAMPSYSKSKIISLPERKIIKIKRTTSTYQEDT